MNESKSEISEIKSQLEAAISTSEKWNELENKRDELEVMIEKLSGEIHQEKRSLHRSHSSQIAANIEKMEALAIELNVRRRDLDHLLDQIEALSSDEINHIQNALIEKILTEHPSEITTYNLIIADKNAAEVKVSELNEVLLSLKQICSLLGVALDERSLVKKRGLLRYILGKSPNLIITKCLNTASELSHDTIKIIDRYDGYQKVRSLLEAFMRECEDKWSYKKIDTVFAKNLTELTSHKANLIEKQIQAKEKLKEAELQLDAWINKW